VKFLSSNEFLWCWDRFFLLLEYEKIIIFFFFSSFPKTFSLKPCNKKLKKKWNLDVNWEGSQKKLGGPKCIFFCHIVISHMVFLCFSLVLFYLKCISQLENLKSISLKSILKSGKKIFKSLWEPNTKRLTKYIKYQTKWCNRGGKKFDKKKIIA